MLTHAQQLIKSILLGYTKWEMFASNKYLRSTKRVSVSAEVWETHKDLVLESTFLLKEQLYLSNLEGQMSPRFKQLEQRRRVSKDKNP